MADPFMDQLGGVLRQRAQLERRSRAIKIGLLSAILVVAVPAVLVLLVALTVGVVVALCAGVVLKLGAVLGLGGGRLGLSTDAPADDGRRNVRVRVRGV